MLQRFVRRSQRQQAAEQRQRLFANQRRHIRARRTQHVNDTGQRAVQLLVAGAGAVSLMMRKGMKRGEMG
jgi:hypothetical protein